jgi:fatty acid desaturase
MGLKENTKDHRLSTRSVRLGMIPSFIYWKMEYHIEHHMFPMVPSYNLPKLYEEIKDQLPKPQNLIEAYKEIIPAVIKKSKDPNYYIPVKIPNS